MSTDSTLAEGRAAVDTATRKTLFCVSSEEYALLAASPARGIYDPFLCEALKHRFNSYCNTLVGLLPTQGTEEPKICKN